MWKDYFLNISVYSYNVICIQKDMIMTAVGAFQWKGGYQLYKPNDKSDVFQAGSEHDSYLGEISFLIV